MALLTRRSIYEILVSGLGGLMGMALAVPTGFYVLAGDHSKKKSGYVEVADLKKLQLGKPQEVIFSRTRVDGWSTLHEKVIAWVVRTGDQNVIAYAPQCTHLGCAYHWEEPTNQFVCPGHASRFSIDGKVVQGPASRPLDCYAVRLENSKLLVDSQIQKA